MLRGTVLLVLLIAACNGDTALPLGDGAPPSSPDLETLDSKVDLDAATAPDLAVQVRRVDVHFTPATPDLQIAVWIEDIGGHVIDTLFVTRLTGQLGLANRPGDGLLKTDFGWPYGRREMVLPVWAHRRDHHYPKLVMGGRCGGLRALSPTDACGGGGTCGADCDDGSIIYHSRVSSYEPFYCSPNGASHIDAMSCASKGTFSKGCFAPSPAYSLYPPRADLQGMWPTANDCPEVAQFSMINDLVAISGATPPANRDAGPISWFPASHPDGDYVAWIELSRESDFNAFHDHPNHDDSQSAWNFEGHPFLGQPSILYRVPFHVGSGAGRYTASSYVGYGAWDGADGLVRLRDNTISDAPGSGAGRLLDMGGARVVVETTE